MLLRPNLRHSTVLTAAAVLLLFYSCRSTPDLVLEDPAFREDQIEAALEGRQFNITPEDYPEIRKLFSDDRPSRRIAGIILAEQTGSELFHTLIADAALDEDPAVAARALEVIRNDPEPYRQVFIRMLESGDSQTRIQALELIALAGGEDLVPLVITYFDDPDAAVRNQAALAVRVLTGRLNPFLQGALEGDDTLVRATAVRTLGLFGDVRDLPVFIGAFNSENQTLRREAQLAALRIGAAGLPLLHEQVLDTEALYRVRLSSLDVMQGLRSPDSLEVLISLLEDDDERIAAKAQSILGTYGLEAVPALTELYRSSSAEYRIQAVRLMAEINDPSSYPVLAEALDDENADVRRLASDSLTEAGEDARPALRNRLWSGESASVSASLTILMNGSDPYLINSGNGGINTEALFLMISLSERGRIAEYLGSAGASPLVSETVLALKDAWEAGDEFAALEADIETGSDPYLYAWRQRELLSVASREALKLSFERLHDYFDNPDPDILSDARAIRLESREMEAEARALKEQLDSMPMDVRSRGEVRLESYRRSRDFLVRTWEYIIPELKPLAEKVYGDRNLNPDALSRESALLD